MNPVESVTSRPLKLLIFLGSVRESTPPKPARLGFRVAQACKQLLDKRLLDIELIDPLSIELDTVFKPHFSYAKNNAPKVLDILADKIQAADGYIMLSPEYNHCMSPALANLLNHFGSSLFAFKPSAIVTYSAGQWGGARAAVNMRTFLSELGCLPVSAMIHIPLAADVFDESGAYAANIDASVWNTYFDRTFDQLVWWANAALSQRRAQAAHVSPVFNRDPSERNAPPIR